MPKITATLTTEELTEAVENWLETNGFTLSDETIKIRVENIYNDEFQLSELSLTVIDGIIHDKNV